MSFHFVDNSLIDKKARKLIRSHVMKGKNVGKVREPRRNEIVRTRYNATPDTGNGHDYTEIQTKTTRKAEYDNTVAALSRRVGNDLTLLSFPVKVNRQSMVQLQELFFYLIDIICPPEFCRPTGVSQWMWFEMLFYDEAYFHCAMALSSACAAFLREEFYDSPIALYHMSQTFRLIGQKLSSDEALSDSTIAVVTSTSVYDRLNGNPRKAMIHFEGVCRIIALRGGIGALAKRNFLIAEKTFRADFELALYCGSRPRFCADDVPRHLILINPSNRVEPSSHEGFKTILYQSVCTELRSVVLDTLSLTQVLREQENRDPRLDPAAFQSTIIYVGHRMIESDLFYLDFTIDNSFDKLVQLALIGFQNTFWLGIGRKLVRFSLLIERFRAVAQSIYQHDRNRRKVVFWALFMGRLSLVGKPDDSWLIPKLKILAEQLELRTWPEVSGTLKEFPWVMALHDPPGVRLWNAIIGQTPSLQSVGTAPMFSGLTFVR